MTLYYMKWAGSRRQNWYINFSGNCFNYTSSSYWI